MHNVNNILNFLIKNIQKLVKNQKNAHKNAKLNKQITI